MSNQPELVLVVEDDPAFLDCLRVALEDDGYTVVGAYNGLEALAELSVMPRPPVAIVTDLEMPFLCGRELLRRVRGDAAHCKVPVIVVTGSSKPEVDAPILLKPVTGAAICRAIRQLRDTVPPPPVDAPQP